MTPTPTDVTVLQAELAREREQVRVARVQCARAQADRDAAREALIRATTTGIDRLDLITHLHRQLAFIEVTFGPIGEPGAQSIAGTLDHLAKEIEEAKAQPGDVIEWADVIMLGMSAALRAGHAPEAIAGAISDKLSIIEARDWPDWRTVDPDKAIEHRRGTIDGASLVTRRQTPEEPDPRDAYPVLAVLAEIATTATEGPARLVVEDVAFLEAAASDDPRLDGEAREWMRSQGHLYHSLPLADAQRRWWDRERSAVEPSAPAVPVDLLTLSTPCPVFYAALGPFLASHEARREGVAITHQPGKTWVIALVDGMPVGCGAVFLPEGGQAELASAYVLPEYRHQGVYRRLLLARTEIANAAGKTRIVATCTPASAAILARLGFVAIGEAAGYTTMSLSAK